MNGISIPHNDSADAQSSRSRGGVRSGIAKLQTSLVFVIAGALCAMSAQTTSSTEASLLSIGSYSGNPDQGGGGYGLQSMLVFPPNGPSSKVLRFPFAINSLAHSVDGRAIYAAAYFTQVGINQKIPGAPERPGLYRFELPSLTMTEVPLAPGLEIFGLAVSARQDKLIASAQIRRNRRLECGLYEILLPAGQTRRVMEGRDCSNTLFGWRRLSLAPDGEKVLAIRRESLELIDLQSRSIQPLGAANRGVWSPDGTWIARINDDGADVLNARTLEKSKRISGEIVGGWSPDSRYLIGQEHRGCPGETGKPVAFDAVTGRKITFQSAKCIVNRGATGWVDVGRP